MTVQDAYVAIGASVGAIAGAAFPRALAIALRAALASEPYSSGGFDPDERDYTSAELADGRNVEGLR